MDTFEDEYFEGGDIVFSECFINSCLDPNFQDRELPDYLFMDEELTRNYDDIYILNDQTVGDKNISRAALLEVTPEGVTFVIGPKNVEEEERVFIKPDYGPAVQIMKYSMQLDQGRDEKCPLIPVANPDIPKTGLAQTPATLPLEEMMRDRGGLIFDPSYKFKSRNDEKSYLTNDMERKLMVKHLLEKLKPGSFIFQLEQIYHGFCRDFDFYVYNLIRFIQEQFIIYILS